MQGKEVKKRSKSPRVKKIALVLFILFVSINASALVRTPSGQLRDEILLKCLALTPENCKNPSLSDFDGDGIGDCEVQDNKCTISKEKEKRLKEKETKEINSFYAQRQTQEIQVLIYYFGIPIIVLALLCWKIKKKEWRSIMLALIAVLVILAALYYFGSFTTLY